ncbi:hypothetical protein D3C81_1678130 [compost metagenome]
MRSAGWREGLLNPLLEIVVHNMITLLPDGLQLLRLFFREWKMMLDFFDELAE